MRAIDADYLKQIVDCACATQNKEIFPVETAVYNLFIKLIDETPTITSKIDPSFITNLDDVKDWNICGYRVEELYKLALILRDRRIEEIDLRDYNNCFLDGYKRAQEEIHKQLEESVNRIIKGVEGN